MDVILGVILSALAGVGVGTFLLPLKFSKTWKWENSWIVGACFMYCILPIIILVLVSSDPWAIYQEVGSKAIIILFVCGIIQGTGALVFTYGTTIMGLSLGYALMIGCIMVFGLLIPFLGAHRDRILEVDGIALMIGLLLLLIGIAFSGKAGLQREQQQPASATGPRRKVSLGLVIAVVLWSGIANSFYYFIHEFGESVRQAAVHHGVHEYFASQFNNLPFFLGMLVINIAISIPRMMKDNSLKNYWSGSRLPFEYLLAAAIGILWFAGQGIAYPIGYTRLGPLGVSVGAALFMGMIIVTSNVVGIRTGEWKNASPQSRKNLNIGLVLLVLAMIVVSLGNSLREQQEARQPTKLTSESSQPAK